MLKKAPQKKRITEPIMRILISEVSCVIISCVLLAISVILHQQRDVVILPSQIGGDIKRKDM